jgi:putative hemolysin
MMQKLLLLNDKMARDIMTPRSDIVAISSQQNLGELVTLASKHSFSRIPVYTDSPDTIEYIIHIPLLSAHLTDPENLQRPVIDFCKKKAFKIPESKIVDDLFFEFQRKRVHMAIVLNEFGETSGLITLEDIVEQIFGEIEDETDEAEVSLEKIEENKLKVQGDTNLEQIEDNLQVSFPEEFPKYKTVGWLILDILHRFPEKGELVEVPGSTIQLEIVSKDEEYIQEVYVTANEDANDE